MASSKVKGRRNLWICIGVAIAIVVIIVIVVPLAVILPRKHHGKKATILFPLYVWPETNSTWDPLYEEVTNYPNLNFTIIINPSSGPGNSSQPSSQYAQQIQRLNAYPNVRTVGYVRTGYASRNLTTVLQEVGIYSGWASLSPTLAMHGIFFDEVPSEYTTSSAEYLATINEAAKNASGLRLDQTVIHNPGAIPDSRYSNINGTDVTVVFEQSYQEYQTKHANLQALPANRTAYSYMIHSVPSMNNGTLRGLVQDLSEVAEYLYLTTLSQNFYESFDPQLPTLCAVMPS
ncbi:hypothetical protein Asppvi_000151 [Aspergillus pseudoviridinutans]|uniref:Spherulin 4-like cell surface protein n=1 Tax=Aspergillus pseudoviridinutans TaxID=1517512 RepID=A0A9P3EPJ4_9EURO|nr:uncharacterized protein Asppvi_000151 [Aspergillus pseudoviridinutans]GIJ81652.1 hypothetical protein Asppvi_000151 [Aspergillus pseudoviridinutans]